MPYGIAVRHDVQWREGRGEGVQLTQQLAGLGFEGGLLGTGELGSCEIKGNAGDAGSDEEFASLYLDTSSFGKLPVTESVVGSLLYKPYPRGRSPALERLLLLGPLVQALLPQLRLRLQEHSRDAVHGPLDD